MFQFRRTAALLALLATANPLAAQSTVAPGPSPHSDSRVQVGIVLPLGQSGTRAENAPRLEAWSERTRRAGGTGTSLEPVRSASHHRLGMSLTGQPRLLVDGREIPQQSGQNNVSALGWAGIAVGVVAVGLGLGLLGVFGRTE
ncbi:MAG: hypothetical protein ACKOPQ_04310 [Novosphingobium sp.]